MDKKNFKKSLGQNFLVNEDICKKIADSLIINQDEKYNLLEIGPGEGALTKYLYEKYQANLTVIEIENKYIETLKEKLPNLSIINGNFLKYDITNYNYIIGNIPYNITSEILLKLALNSQNINQIVLMIQNDAYERIIVTKNKEDQTSLSVLLKTVFNYKHHFEVSKNDFFPKPTITSTVFCLFKRKNYDFDIKDYYYFLLKAFSSKRKKLINNISTSYDKDKIINILNINNINLNTRPEDLTYNDFVNIYLELKK